MAEPYRRKDSVYWWIGYTDPATGKRKAQSTGKTTLREARTEARRILTSVENRTADPAPALSIHDALERVAARAEARKIITADDVRDHVDRLLGRREGKGGITDPSRPIASLCAADIDTLVTMRLAEGYSRNTVNHELAVLSAAWRGARDMGIRVPVLSFKRLKGRAKTRRFTREEFYAIRRELHPDTPLKTRGAAMHSPPPGSRVYRERQDAHDLFVVLCMTGARAAEANSLTIQDVASQSIALYGWKTQSERVVPLAGVLREIAERRRADAKPGQTLLFPGREGALRSGPSRAITRAINRAGCNDDPLVVRKHGRATIHSCRHSFASWLRDAGVPLSDIQVLLGHSSITMTQRYAQPDEQAILKRAAGVLQGVAD